MANEGTAVPHPRRLALYASTIAGIPLVMLLLAFVLVVSPFFQRYCEYNWNASQGGLYATKDSPCEILIYGDSSAMTGLDPGILSQRTHLTTCNIATTLGGMTVLGISSLDDYLQRNPRPKYLLLQFNQPSMTSNLHGYPLSWGLEALIPMLRSGHARFALSKMLAKPDFLLALMKYVYANGSEEAVSHHLLHLRRENVLTMSASSYTVIAPRTSLTSCPSTDTSPIRPSPVLPENIDWIRQTREHFSGDAQKVILDASPTSICNPNYRQWAAALSGVVDNPQRLYPIQLFVDADHLVRAGAVRLSEETSDQILALENQALKGPTPQIAR